MLQLNWGAGEPAAAASSQATTTIKPRRGDITVVKGYALLGTLGVGSFGKVRLGIHCETGRRVAVKIIQKGQTVRAGVLNKLAREIRAMSGLRHPHVIHVHELIDTPTTVFIVMEYVEGGELFDYISQNSRLNEPEAVRIMRQILSAVHFCHSKMICHRDIKPENVLLDGNMDVKLGDFGLSNSMRYGTCLKTPCGSPNYASPEVICGKSYSGPEVDVWSCGIIFYVLLCGCLPFDDDEMSILFMKIKLGKYHEPPHLSESAKSLLRRMIDVNPVSRITMKEILMHPWFVGCTIDGSGPNAATYISGFSSPALTFYRNYRTDSGENEPILLEKPEDDDLEPASAVTLKCSRFKPRWYIGLPGFKSESQCVTVLTETLKELDYQWRFEPGYKVFCKRENSPQHKLQPQFAMQLYKMKYMSYLLDIQMKTGELMPIMNEGIRLVEALKRKLNMSTLLS
ncbi:protein kinase domain containing protein, putative [Babesia bigemina]|uniref:Protein kinase domain containing protein, putative n=1 Tax=Babesia bigemina TaxID=5866 RepID=A0A061DBP3_BABBI|nr:protein kinase domain containing protein, putative [Babesia bigemina]CDR97367.1 protein kinase domain containing protein, putative [Babesia bigemina]|eukprot:XP_012769553.1 protein kinase domain containing protein, putative [Babesia bigemina]